jgi:hypothetical protein
MGRSSVRLERVVGVTSFLEEVAADGVEAAVSLGPGVGAEALEQFEPGLGPGDHAHGDGMVQRDDRVVVKAEQEAVEGNDLRPVGRLGALRFIVERGDRRLELVRANRAMFEGGRNESRPFVDGSAVPEAAIFFGHGDERAVSVGAGPVTGVHEEHQREQAGDLGVAGERRPQVAARLRQWPVPTPGRGPYRSANNRTRSPDVGPLPESRRPARR